MSSSCRDRVPRDERRCHQPTDVDQDHYNDTALPIVQATLGVHFSGAASKAQPGERAQAGSVSSDELSSSKSRICRRARVIDWASAIRRSRSKPRIWETSAVVAPIQKRERSLPRGRRVGPDRPAKRRAEVAHRMIMNVHFGMAVFPKLSNWRLFCSLRFNCGAGGSVFEAGVGERSGHRATLRPVEQFHGMNDWNVRTLTDLSHAADIARGDDLSLRFLDIRDFACSSRAAISGCRML